VTQDREPRETAHESTEWTDDPQELLRRVRRELRIQVRRHPYAALAAAAGLGIVLGGGAWRWVAAGAALALREGARWAAREGLRRIVEAPSPAAFSRAREVPRERRTPHH
jgi:hypothetical protein